MKTSFLRIVSILIVTIFMVGCGGSSSYTENTTGSTENTDNTNNDDSTTGTDDIVSKSEGTAPANKGPFSLGSVVTAYKLNSDGTRTETTETNTTVDDKGTFTLTVPWTGPTELNIVGEYLNETTGTYMNDGDLSSIVDMKAEGNNSLGINIFTHMAVSVIRQRMQEDSGTDFTALKEESNEVIANQFNLKLDDETTLEDLDMTSSDKEANVQLLQISAALMNTPNPTETLASIAEDISDGEVDDEGQAALSELGEEMEKVDIIAVAQNIENNVEDSVVPKTLDVLDGTLAWDSNISFPEENDALLNTVYNSLELTVNGIIGESADLTISNGSYQLNGEAISSADVTVSNGDRLQLVGTSASTYNTQSETVVVIGGESIPFVIRTQADPTANDDAVPNEFDFGFKKNVTPNSTVSSNAVVVSGINKATSISIDNGTFTVNGATASEVNNGDSVVVTLNSGALSESVKATVTIGGVEGKFIVTSEATDNMPTIEGTFQTVSAVEKSTEVLSNELKVLGINVAVPVSITGAEFSINGGDFSTSGTISLGDTVKVKLLSSNEFDTRTEVGLNIGSVVVPFAVETESDPVVPDSTPNAFSFNAQTTRDASTAVESEMITVSSINQAVTISVENGEYSVNGSDFIASDSTVNAGDTVVLQITPADYALVKNATLTIGGVSATFTVTTIKDETLDNIAFASKEDVLRSTLIESETVTISGVNVPMDVSIVGGEYSVDGGDYGSSAASVSEGQTLKVRVMSASSALTSTSAILSVGDLQLPFIVKTQANIAPVATADTVETMEDTMVSIDVLANDSDAEGDALIIANLSSAANGTVVVSDAKVNYTPKTNFVGTDTFTYQANDGTVSGNTVTVTLNVTAVNDAPTVSNMSVTTQEEVAKAITLEGTDVDADALTYELVTSPTNGSVEIVNGVATYTPNADFSGTDSFTYKANDTLLDSNEGTVTVTVSNVNDAPVLTAIANQAMNEDATPLTVTLSANDGDSSLLTYSAVSSDSSVATVAVDGTTLTITAVPNASGEVSISVTANDGIVDSAVETFMVVISPVNDVPTVSDRAVTVAEDSAQAITLTATDVDGDALTFTIVSQPAHGTVVLSGAVATYAPEANYVGADSFTYSASDSSETSTVSTVSITVTDEGDAPTLESIEDVTIEEDATAVTVTLSASDVDGDALTYEASSSDNTKVTVAVSGTTLTLTPLENMFGTVTVSVIAKDGTYESAVETFTLTINSVNDAPVTVVDTVTTLEDTAVEIDVLANDTDVEEDSLSITNLTTASSGTVTIVNGKVSYVPNDNFNGTDSFSYTANDGELDGNSVTVTVTVTAKNDAPVITGTPITTIAQDSAYSFTPAGEDVDADTTLVYSIENKPTWANFDTSTGTLSGTPTNDEVGITADIQISVTDGIDSSSLALFSLEVTNVNDAPTITGTPATTVLEGSEYHFEAVGADIDVGTTLTYSIVNTPSWASLDTATGILTGIPSSDDVGTTTGIVISVSDGEESVSLPAFDLEVTSSGEDLSSVIVGSTNYFVTESGILGERTYNEDGTYTGVLALSSEYVLNVSGTYIIEANVITLTRTSPSDRVTIVEYVGEGFGGTIFDVTFDGNTSQSISFTTEVDRDAYVESLDTLESRVVGATNYFVTESGIIGERTYNEDGTYTGQLVLVDDTELNVSGTYTIEGDVITIVRTSPSDVELLLTYTGESAEGATFEVTVNGSTFQSVSFTAAAARDAYLSDDDIVDTNLTAAISVLENTDFENDDIAAALDESKGLLTAADETDKEAQLGLALFALAEITNSEEVSNLVNIDMDGSTISMEDYLPSILEGMSRDTLEASLVDNIIDLSETSTSVLHDMALKLQDINQTVGEVFTDDSYVFTYNDITISSNQSKMLRAALLGAASKLEYIAAFNYLSSEDIEVRTTTLNGVTAEYDNISSDPVSVLNRTDVGSLSSTARLSNSKALLLEALALFATVDGTEEDDEDRANLEKAQEESSKIALSLNGTTPYIVEDEDYDQTEKVYINLAALYAEATVLDMTHTVGHSFSYESDEYYDYQEYTTGDYNQAVSQFYNEAMAAEWIAEDGTVISYVEGQMDRPDVEISPSIPTGSDSHISAVIIKVELINDEGTESYEGDDVLRYFFNGFDVESENREDNYTQSEDINITYRLDVEDMISEGEPSYTFELLDAPSWLHLTKVDVDKAYLTADAGESGQACYTVRVTNEFGQSREERDCLYVEIPEPRISLSTQDVTLNQGESKVVTFSLENIDSVQLIEGVPDFVTLDGNEILINPTLDTAEGYYYVELNGVSSHTDWAVSKSLHINVNTVGSNHAPTISLSQYDTVLNTVNSETASVEIYADDADGDTVTYGVMCFSCGTVEDQAPSFVTLSDNIITVSPTSGDEGSYDLQVSVSDENGGYSSENLHIEVVSETSSVEIDIDFSQTVPSGSYDNNTTVDPTSLMGTTMYRLQFSQYNETSEFEVEKYTVNSDNISSSALDEPYTPTWLAPENMSYTLDNGEFFITKNDSENFKIKYLGLLSDLSYFNEVAGETIFTSGAEAYHFIYQDSEEEEEFLWFNEAGKDQFLLFLQSQGSSSTSVE